MRLALFIDLKINADRIGAFLILADVFEFELLARTRLLFLRAVGVGDEGLAPLDFRQRFEELDNFVELGRVRITLVCFAHRHKGPVMIFPESREINDPTTIISSPATISHAAMGISDAAPAM